MLWIKIISVFLKVYSFGTRHKYFGESSQLHWTNVFKKKLLCSSFLFFRSKCLSFHISLFFKNIPQYINFFSLRLRYVFNYNCWMRRLYVWSSTAMCGRDIVLFASDIAPSLFVTEIHSGTGALHLHKEGPCQLNSRRVSRIDFHMNNCCDRERLKVGRLSPFVRPGMLRLFISSDIYLYRSSLVYISL